MNNINNGFHIVTVDLISMFEYKKINNKKIITLFDEYYISDFYMRKSMNKF